MSKLLLRLSYNNVKYSMRFRGSSGSSSGNNAFGNSVRVSQSSCAATAAAYQHQHHQLTNGVENHSSGSISCSSSSSSSSSSKPIGGKTGKSSSSSSSPPVPVPRKRLKKEDSEKLAKVKTEELEKEAKELGLRRNLNAYLDLAVFNGQLLRGYITLMYYRQRGKVLKNYTVLSDVSSYDILLHGYAGKANYNKVKEIFNFIKEDGLKPTIQSFAGILECLGRLPENEATISNIKFYLDMLKNEGNFTLDDLFNKCVFYKDQRETVLKSIRLIDPQFKPKMIKPDLDYVNELLNHLNSSNVQNQPILSQSRGLVSFEELQKFTQDQVKLEIGGIIKVKSIEYKEDNENTQYFRDALEETEKKWVKAIEDSVKRNIGNLLSQTTRSKSTRLVNLYQFLKFLPPEEYSKILLQEIRKLAEGSETYSPAVILLHRDMGMKILSRYQVAFKKEKGVLEKLDKMYKKYSKWYLNPSEESNGYNSRQKWQELLYESSFYGSSIDVVEKSWPNGVLCGIGKFLFEIIMRDIKIDVNILKPNTKIKIEQVVPAFYTIFRMHGVQAKEEIKPHPILVKLFQAASRNELTFESTQLPMLCPPIPWASIRTGGYMLSEAKIIRLPFSANQQMDRLINSPPQELYPSLDSLNQLGCVPWRINERVLDIIIQVFNNNGDVKIDIPPPPSSLQAPPSFDKDTPKEEKSKIYKERLLYKRRKADMYSLWCDALYKFSLANHYRKDILWFPHNMDFRGRVYPCPPHLNHLGGDVSRGILRFARGEPLGSKGLDWLKIHLINLTGLKKRDSLIDRLAYANEIMPKILDSADNPLTGKKWWMESDEPWQTLATCFEIADASRSPDPSAYICHFPIHQDGSCNGLQHYAALGRDHAGAISVNLAPAIKPQDVYSAVATLVEKQRARDAQEGNKIAQVLEGFIQRKVIKQTVMTTVYGVTRFGARLQIAKQLKDIEEFPKEHMWAASIYLVGRTFESLREMFTSTKEIQDWLTDCAKMISNTCSQNVEWKTPLGLPIVQPYSKLTKKSFDYGNPLKLSELTNFDSFERPNVMKQKNAFPPNFIHALDSSHMMLTSIHTERAGITFVSVHDCFWTHPSTVEIMNQICREQFVSLHSEPILQDLSTFLLDRFSYKDIDLISEDDSLVGVMKSRLNNLLAEVPDRGNFDLCSVLNSVYFFS